MGNDFQTGLFSNNQLNTQWAVQGFLSPQHMAAYGGTSEATKNQTAIKVLEGIKAAAQPFTASQSKGDLALTKAQEFRELGMTAVAKQLEAEALKTWKEFQISVAGYKRINRSEIDKFKEELMRISDISSRRELSETPLAKYVGQDTAEGVGIPPADILEKLRVAKASKLFDAFSVLHIKLVPDPILVGKIEESKDLYFIGEWGDDVKLSDIVK